MRQYQFFGTVLGVTLLAMPALTQLAQPGLPEGPVLRVQGQAPANSMTQSRDATPGQPAPTAASPNTTPPGRSTMPTAPTVGPTGSSGQMPGTVSGGRDNTTAPNAAGTGGSTTGTPAGGGG